MLDTVKQWIVVIVAAFLCLPVANWVLPGLEGIDGQIGVPIALCHHPMEAIAKILCAFIWFSLIAVAGGKLTHRYTGAVIYGLGWVFILYRSPGVIDILQLLSVTGRGSVNLFVWDCVYLVLWAVLSMITIGLLTRFTPTRYEDENKPLAKENLRTVITLIISGLILTWVFVRTDIRGQVVFGTMGAFAVATMITRLLWPNCNGSVLFIAPFVAGCVGYISGVFIVGNDALEMLISSSLWPLVKPMPLDYLGSGVVGVSLGIGLARSFSQEPEQALQSNTAVTSSQDTSTITAT